MADGSSGFVHDAGRHGYRHVGVISNPTSFSRGLNPREAGFWPEIHFAMPRSQAALRRTLRDFAREGVDLVVVAGGDGTLRDVLSALPRAYRGPMPEIALIATGNTNLAARALRLGRSQPGALRRLLESVAAEERGELKLKRVSCPALEVEWRDDPERPRLRGFFLGSGAYASGKQLADRVVHEHLQQGPAVAITVALSVLKGLFGRESPHAAVPCAMRVDGRPTLDGHQFVFLATTLPRLMFGLWPFRPEGTGELHYASISAPARRLWASVPGLLAGLGGSYLRRNGVSSGLGSSIDLEINTAFVLDGEFFDSGRNGVRISAGPAVTFVGG